MKIKKAQSPLHAIATQINATTAIPFKTLTHLFAIVTDLLVNIPVMNTVWRERLELETLIDRNIKDIGLTPDSVRRETKRSYFDIPPDRKRSFRRVHTTCKSKSW